MLRLIALGLLTGCQGFLTDPPEVAQCQKYVLAKLEKPSTYKRIEYASLRLPGNPEYWQVGIDYNFVNASNATVRGSQVCDFPLVDGKPDTSKYIDFDRQT